MTAPNAKDLGAAIPLSISPVGGRLERIGSRNQQ